MATLIKTTDDIKEFVSTAFNFDFTNIQPYVKKVEREQIKSILGATLYDTWTATAPTTGVTKEVYDLMREASANLATLFYIPVGSVNIADNGILVVESTTAKQAEWWQIRDLQRSLGTLGFSAIDEALKIMEANEGSFAGWSTSEGYTTFKELYTPKTQDFQKWFNISNSRVTFMALRPFLLENQIKIFNWLDAATLALILANDTTVKKTALKYLQAAQVNHTVAKAAETGIFEISATGMYFKAASLPGAGVTGNYNKLSEPELQRLVASRQQSGDEYLKLLRTHIEANTDVFTAFIEVDTTVEVFVNNTKSIVTF